MQHHVQESHKGDSGQDSQTLITLIISCVSTSFISVLYNGGALEPFLPSSGIRQGGPFSPCLFILYIEVLGAFIIEKCDAKLWDPIKASRGGLVFSYLLFADDLVLFAKANRKNCLVVKDVLDSFCSFSGKKVSNAKSRVFFSPNVNQDTKTNLCEILEFRYTPTLEKYLGFPVEHSGTRQDFGIIIERIQSHLTSWIANLLSFTGRLVVTQSVSTTIPNYAMQCVALPSKVLHSVDKLSQEFLWGSTDNKKKLHLVSWKKIAKPKTEGGLSLHAAKAKNVALLAKLNWRLKTETNSLWAKVLNYKYKVAGRVTNAHLKPRSCSNIWSVIRKGEAMFNRGSKWVVSRDSHLSRWNDKWLDKEPLRSLISSPLNHGEEITCLKEATNFSGWH